jgi:hypothetical protein
MAVEHDGVDEPGRKAKDDLLKAPPGVRFYYEETQKRRG